MRTFSLSLTLSLSPLSLSLALEGGWRHAGGALKRKHAAPRAAPPSVPAFFSPVESKRCGLSRRSEKKGWGMGISTQTGEGETATGLLYHKNGTPSQGGQNSGDLSEERWRESALEGLSVMVENDGVPGGEKKEVAARVRAGTPRDEKEGRDCVQETVFYRFEDEEGGGDGEPLTARSELFRLDLPKPSPIPSVRCGDDADDADADNVEAAASGP